MKQDDPLARWRSEFPILEDCVYLNSNSLGAIPRGTIESLQEYAITWARRGIRAWEEKWWNFPREIGNLIAGLIGAGRDQVSIQPSVTMAQWVALSSIPQGKRKKVVYSGLNFPSVRYFYQAQPHLEVEAIASHNGISIPIDELLEAIDEETLVVPISHVVYKSSFIQDVERIVRKAHSVGAYVILDSYHSCGVIPFDVRKLKADFVVGGVLKWLCGGPGIAFLYVRPDLACQLTPSLTGWLAHQSPFEFQAEMEWTSGAYRFMSGTPNVPGLYAARRGLEIINEVGPTAIREKSVQMTRRIIEMADDLEIEIRSPRACQERGGHVTLSPKHPEKIGKELIQRNFIIDYRPDSGLRVAPHFYNTFEEIERFMQELQQLRSELRDQSSKEN